MGIPPQIASTATLLSQAEWLKALARRLVRDPNAADDVAQQTLATALASPPSADRDVRPWLGRVARNVARMRARSEAARAQRERRIVGDTESLSAAELAEKLEAQRLLVEAVQGLAEPYRATILLHYWEHKTSDEIAALHGIAPGTVRWRLKQGVDALRDALDARHGGDRRAWSAVLAPLAATDTHVGAIATTSLLAGILVMKSFVHVVVALVVLVAIGTGVWFFARPGLSSDSGKPLSQEHVAVEFKPIVATDESAVLAATQVQSRTPVVKAVLESPPAPSELASIEARIVDVNGSPIRGAHLALESDRVRELVVTDAEGRARAELEIEFDHDSPTFLVHAAGFATRSVDANVQRGSTTYLGDVVMQPGGAISGRVVDAASEPVAGAQVGLDKVDIPQSELEMRRESMSNHVDEPSTVSAADGTFRIDGTPIGLLRVVATSSRHLPGYSGIVEVRAGQESAGVDVELETLSVARIVRGIVLDPDGKPVPDAVVRYRAATLTSTSSGSFDADAEGRFHELVRPGADVELFAHDDAGRWSDAAAVHVKPSAREIVLQFAAPKWIDVTVASSGGQKLEKYSGSCQTPDRRQALSFLAPGVHADGAMRVLLPSTSFIVVVEAPGHLTSEVGPFDPNSTPPSLAVTLEAVPGITGRILGDGGGSSGARVVLYAAARRRVEHNGFLVQVDPTPIDETRSNSDGSFALTPRVDGNYFVRAESAGLAPAEIGPLLVDVRRGVAHVDLRPTRGGTLEGRVLASSGFEAAGTIIGLSRGDALATTQRVGPDGSFRFERLMPGRWLVRIVDEEISPDGSYSRSDTSPPPEIPWNCTIAEGEVTSFDIGAAAGQPACILLGSMRFTGAEMGRWSARLVSPGTRDLAPVPLDATGSFRIATEEPIKARLVLTGMDGAFDGMRVLADVELRGGETRWKLDIETAKVDVRGRASATDGKEPLVLLVVRNDTTFFVRPIPEEGEVQLSVPAGRARLMRMPKTAGSDPDPRAWTGGIELTLTAGAACRVERP